MAASMLLSLPLSPATLLATKAAPPWLVALVGTLAAGLTAAFDHAVITRAVHLREGDGRIARWLAQIGEKARAAPAFGASGSARYLKAVLERLERLAKVAPFLTTGIFAGFPLPFWIVRVLMPLSRYPRGRYVAAVMLGRFGRLFVIATFGTFVEIPNEILLGLIAFGVVAAIVGALVRRFRTSTDRATDPSPRSPKPAPTSEA
jgi:hypothetical protein